MMLTTKSAIAGIVVVLLCSAAVFALSYKISVQTNSQAYVGAATVQVSGQVSPAPGPNTAVLFRVLNSKGQLITADQAMVNGTTGLYSESFIAGGSSAWTEGNYVVNATWGAYGQTIFATTSFFWSSTPITTTTTTTTTTTSTITSTTSTTTSTAIPEFDTNGLLVASLIAIVAVAIVTHGVTRPKNSAFLSSACEDG